MIGFERVIIGSIRPVSEHQAKWYDLPRLRPFHDLRNNSLASAAFEELTFGPALQLLTQMRAFSPVCSMSGSLQLDLLCDTRDLLLDISVKVHALHSA